MKSESLNVRIGGYDLHRLVMRPDDGITQTGVMMCYHGQGDHAERYTHIVNGFTKRGILCVVTELPGHGLSTGKRGHCGDEELLDAVIDNTLGEYVVPLGLPYGVMGHSMGGLLAVRHVVLAGMKKLPPISFAWISSPLINPVKGRSQNFVKMVQILAKIIPSVTISTRVKAADCTTQSSSEDKTVSHPKHQLWHSRISLGWAAELISCAAFVRKNISAIPQAIPILITQGSDDRVCPADQTREFYEFIPSEKKQYVELEGMLHEPFKGEGSEQLFTALEIWLESTLSKGE